MKQPHIWPLAFLPSAAVFIVESPLSRCYGVVFSLHVPLSYHFSLPYQSDSKIYQASSLLAHFLARVFLLEQPSFAVRNIPYNALWLLPSLTPHPNRHLPLVTLCQTYNVLPLPCWPPLELSSRVRLPRQR